MSTPEQLIPPPTPPSHLSPPPVPAYGWPEENYDEYAESGHRRRRHRSRGALKKIGRIWVAAIFVLFTAKQLLLLVTTFSERMEAAFVVGMIWNTALCIAMWQRRIWARYLYLVYILMTTLFVVINISELLKSNSGYIGIAILTVCGVLDAGIASVLLWSSSLRHLTSRNYS